MNELGKLKTLGQAKLRMLNARSHEHKEASPVRTHELRTPAIVLAFGKALHIACFNFNLGFKIRDLKEKIVIVILS